MRLLSRRAFLTTGGAAALTFVTVRTPGVTSTTAAARAGAAGEAPAPLGSMAAPFTRSLFDPHVSTPFTVKSGSSARGDASGRR